MTTNNAQTEQEFIASQQAKRQGGKPFTVSTKSDRASQETSTPLAPKTASTAIPTARESALALAAQSNEAIASLQGTGLQNAAAYVQRKTRERNAVVERVSDAIAYLNDPDVLEADIMSAAAAKVQARSDAWGYVEPVVDFDNLFALPASSQRLLSEA